MKIAIIDADLIGRKKHRFPNLASMKISSYRKTLGDEVELLTTYERLDEFDYIYLSKVFTDTEVPNDVLCRENITYGGTGFFYDKAPSLPTEIEHIMPDYHLYDTWIDTQIMNGGKMIDFRYYIDYSIGFMTRGCFRQCEFCVNRNYRKVEVHSPLAEFHDLDRPKIYLLDDNFLGSSEWQGMLMELQSTNKPFQFKQGLDERLLTDLKCQMLFSSKYDGDYIFAFDNVADYEIIEEKLHLIRRYTSAVPKFYIFCGFDRDNRWDEEFWKQDLWDIWRRLELLMKHRCLPYIMRFNRYCESPYAGMYITLARWCNQPSFFKKKSFREFVISDQGDKKIDGASMRYMKQIESELPYLAKQYFDMKYTEMEREVTKTKMRLYVYDCEVYHYDWIVIFKDLENKVFTVIHNDEESLKEFIDSDGVYCGFNSKHYDQFIVKAICNDASIAEIKELNDYIISGGQGWEHPLIRGNYYSFNSIDIKDDMQMGLSLKAIEGHLGMSVEESTVPFDLDRPLTQAELEETIRYCKHDVDTTEQLVEVRKEYLKSKMSVGRMVGLSDAKALSMTNAKLTSALLQATANKYGDERQYSYPPNLCMEYIPQEVIAFFDKLHDTGISDDKIFKDKLNITVGGCPCVIGYGGIHAAIPCYQEQSQGTRTIRNYDVASLYPSIMIQCGYTSRSIPSADKFKDVYHTRLAAKKSGDKATANALKLVLNTTYGAMLNQYNDLYDPRMGRSVCVSGQLFILELAQRYVQSLETVKIIQLNTDGLMVSIEESELPAIAAINGEWQQRTGFMLEEDTIERIVQKDVNNYVEVSPNKEVKLKGGYLVRGVITDHSDPLSGKTGGAWNINNNARIVAMAIKEYFINGTQVEKTINECNDIFQFQLIAKAGVKYREAYHLVGDEKQAVQKVNRVYATKDTHYGKLFKVKAETDATAKIEMLPDHCIIDNNNHLSIEDIDKSFYVEMAKKRINDFLGIKPEKKGRSKKMATTTKTAEKPMNVFQKLLCARQKFLEIGVSKSGKNVHLKFKYFELDDIIPAATPIFAEIGLLPLVTFDNDTAKMVVVNADAPDERIEFTSPMRNLDGNAAMNAIQALGATETYQRRYLYMVALDICEPDGIDGTLGSSVPEQETSKTPPASTETREEVKNKLTNSEGQASELQIRQLKNALKKLKSKDATKEEWIATIAIQSQGFTVITKTECEKILTKVAELLGGDEDDA